MYYMYYKHVLKQCSRKILFRYVILKKLVVILTKIVFFGIHCFQIRKNY